MIVIDGLRGMTWAKRERGRRKTVREKRGHTLPLQVPFTPIPFEACPVGRSSETLLYPKLGGFRSFCNLCLQQVICLTPIPLKACPVGLLRRPWCILNWDAFTAVKDTKLRSISLFTCSNFAMIILISSNARANWPFLFWYAQCGRG